MLTELLYGLFKKICETDELDNERKQAHLINLPKKEDLQEYKNWNGIIQLSSTGKVLSRVILEWTKNELDERLQGGQAGFCKYRSCTDNIASVRVMDLFWRCEGQDCDQTRFHSSVNGRP